MKQDMAAWRALGDELAAWREAGRQPRLWLRDDDAVLPTAALDRLLEMTRRHGVPVALAVIPAETGVELAARLAGEPHATVVVHGWSHANHAAEGRKKQELGADRPVAAVMAELAAALARLGELHGDKAAPVLVPPWNRIDASLLPHLPGLGFKALSAFGPAFTAPLAVVNSTVDIIDWHRGRGCRNHVELAAEISSQLGAAREDATNPPVGLLTHHLVHDAEAWRFLETLFETTAEAGSWLPVDELIRPKA